jgi:hypothetical protein
LAIASYLQPVTKQPVYLQSMVFGENIFS